MKKLLLTALFATTALSVTAKDTITFAMEATYAPFETTNEKGEIVGFDVDLAKALCTELDATCEFKNTSFDSLIQSLKFKKFDAIISAMDITEKRQKQVSFTTPYLENSASFVALKGTTPQTAKVVGVQNGTTFQKYLMKKGTQYKLKPYSTLQNAILDLKNGRIDMIFGDTPVLAKWLEAENSVIFTGEKVKDKEFFGIGYGIAVNKSNTSLLEKLNAALKTVKENGTLDKIYKNWIAKK
ncbi:transporter substrate-binding domain-containing protein [Pasteurella skyensis]|uniref:Transporter substrate-binding domain-containing protein n=1 Tax=Phocoenobacter skyensis TaxID=97481 RepID=A0AAJ6P185_9PAST|nr:transporter substrate-binding domain-containing protein [Pasteurella skyensis]MDP8163155.1 transporter substrate-binding domain-containing protein [Pasteurella skyensis]MDP8173370.1 transporter substrate-binding domain-containing protein [Pasteurella skyensis]MDP8177783.1 transporter substrate-binding domain-containing protein [Pasteurella skyensis]MDP8179538.1 transporter substrate-binding domain-containing protein [Pasteurella skyensis]MDP8182490.1 transporter substrate-binding domain-con